MRDRAYFSARAILLINLRAKVRSQEHASKYPIPTVSSSPFRRTDPDVYHVIHILERNSDAPRPTLDFVLTEETSYAHRLWVSNLLVDLARVGPKPILQACGHFLNVASTNHQAMIANILLVWHMFLGGRVEEGTVWVVEKSYAVVLLPFISTYLIFRTPAIRWNTSSLTYLQE